MCGRFALSMTPADLAEVFGTRNAPAERADDALSAFGGIWPGADGPLWSARSG